MDRAAVSSWHLMETGMPPFAITDLARTEIRRRFTVFGYQEPVARVYQTSNVSALFDESTRKAFVESKTDDEIRQIASERISAAGAVESYIEVGVCERRELTPDQIAQIDGIDMAMGKELYRMLEGCTLTFQDGRFVIFDAKGRAQTLIGLAKRLAER